MVHHLGLWHGLKCYGPRCFLRTFPRPFESQSYNFANMKLWFPTAQSISMVIFIVLGSLPSPEDSSGEGSLRIPTGHAIKIDGVISPGEWDDAQSVEIEAAPDWKITVLYKHHAERLYLAFRNTLHGKERLYPEVLIDSKNAKSDSWQASQWWIHASYSLCDAEGTYNVYGPRCARSKGGWNANSPPTTDVVEFEIALSKLDLQPGKAFGLAFDMTNATGDSKQRWALWPHQALLQTPKTWSQAVLAQ